MLVAALGVARAVFGFGWGLLPLLAVGPGMAAAMGGVLYVVAVGTEALAVCAVFLVRLPLGSQAYQTVGVAAVAVAGVTAGGVLATRFRTRREQDLAQVRRVAEAAQDAVLRPVPRRAGPVKFAARYLSASQQATVGGDLYEVVTTAQRVRLVVGDAQGKGLPALRSAAAILGLFRDAAHEEETLAALASRIDTSLERQFGAEQFVTAVFAEINSDGTAMELVNCGHPPPLLIGAGIPRFVSFPRTGLPLGLGLPDRESYRPVAVPFGLGGRVLFYTDGVTEARNDAGEYFPLLDSSALRSGQSPDALVDGLTNEMTTFAGGPPDDDVALVLAYYDYPLTARRPTGPRGPVLDMAHFAQRDVQLQEPAGGGARSGGPGTGTGSG